MRAPHQPLDQRRAAVAWGLVFALCAAGCRAPAGARPPVRAPGRGGLPTRAAAPAGRAQWQPTEALGPVVLDGRLADPSPAGAEITVYSVGEGGVLTEVAVAPAQAGDDGRFEVLVLLPTDGPHDLVVTAAHRGSGPRGSALVPSWAMVDGALVAPPLSAETAVESDVYLAALRSGAWKIHLGSGELRSFISPRVARRLRGSERYGADVEAMGRASAAAVEAWYGALLAPEVGLDLEHLRAVLAAVGWARATLDAHLFAAETAQDADEARAAHQGVVRAAYAAVGVGPAALAFAAEASATALRRAAPAMSDAVRPLLIGDAEALRAHHVVAAIDELLARAGAPEQVRATARRAGERLALRLLRASAYDGGSDEDLERAVARAWAEYQRALGALVRALRRGRFMGGA